MTTSLFLGFADVGLAVFAVAWLTLAILVLALLAAAANHFFRSVARFDDELREATMELGPAQRRRFFAIYDSLHPKSPAAAWFLAVGLGPVGANLYRAKWPAFFGALVTFNGFGAWWIESWFSTPHLVLIENRALLAHAFQLLHADAVPPPIERGPGFVPSIVPGGLVAR